MPYVYIIEARSVNVTKQTSHRIAKTLKIPQHFISNAEKQENNPLRQGQWLKGREESLCPVCLFILYWELKNARKKLFVIENDKHCL